MSASRPPAPHDRPWHRLHLWQIAWVRDVAWAAVAVLILWIGYELRAVFIPVLIGLALAYLFHPLMRYAERRWRAPRWVSIAGILAVLVLAAAGLAAWLGPLLVNQVIALAQAAPDYIRKLAEEYNINIQAYEQDLDAWTAGIKEDPVRLIADNVGVFFAGTTRAVNVLGAVMSTATFLAMAMVLIPIYFCVFAASFESIRLRGWLFVPQSRRDRAVQLARRMDRTVSAYVRGRVIVALILGVLLSIGWSPPLADVPYWLLLGLFAGLLSFIPYAAVLGWAAAITLKWLEATTGPGAAGFDFWAVLLWPSVVFGVVQLFEGWLLTPWVQGRTLDLSPWTVLIVVLIGGAAGGLFGLLVCIPIAACLKILLVEIFLPRLRRWAAEH